MCVYLAATLYNNIETDSSNLPDFPLVMALNARSLILKKRSISNLLSEYGTEILLAFETWEQENNTLESILHKTGYKYISKFRKENRRKNCGGGVAVIFNEERFIVSRLDCITVPDGVEAVWGIAQPKFQTKSFSNICEMCL